MALPKIDKLSSEFEVSKNDSNEIKQEIVKLGKSIQESSSLGLKAATQAVVGNVPNMIKDLTDDIKSGSINNFATAMNKLITLTEDLGINLREYNSELADTVERFTGNQAKLQEELGKLREQGIRAEIDEDKQRVRILTQNDIIEYNREREVNNQSIQNNRDEIEQKTKLLNLTDEELKIRGENRKDLETEIKTRADRNKKLEDTNQKIDEKTGTTADTGRGEQGFGKFQELKEAFMVIPDTIGEAMGAFSKAGKGVFTGLTNLFTKGGLARAFKGLVNFFKTARIMLMAKFLLVVAAIQFVAEKIDVIAAFFKRIFDKIAGFFKAIGDWFADSWIGRKLGLGGKDDGEADKIIEKEKAKEYKAMDEGTYAVGEDGAEIKDENLSVRDILKQNTGDASVAEGVAMDNRARIEGNKKRALHYTGSDATITQDDYADQVSIEDIIGGKEVRGDQLKDGSTSSMLKSLETESAKSSQNSVINIQNNTNQTNSQSSATNVSGFLDHEPDTSFKYVRRSNGDEYI